MNEQAAKKEPKPRDWYLSKTTPEKYFHLKLKEPMLSPTSVREDRRIKAVTAFCRKAGSCWSVTYAECDVRDNFCHRRGRNEARKKWFQGTGTPIVLSTETPTFDTALAPYLVQSS